MTRHSARISLTGGAGGVVVVDGVRLGGVTAIELVHAVKGGAPTLRVDFMLIGGVSADVASAEVVVPEKTHASLVALGWTPPDGA